MQPELATLLSSAIAADPEATSHDDETRERILDAALQEGAAVGLRRVTLDDVARRAAVGRMTLYRRFARRDDLVEALLVRECGRFLAAVAAGLDEALEPEQRVAGGFVAAMRFVRTHPLLQHLAHADPGAVLDTVAANDAQLLNMGRTFIAAQIEREHPGAQAGHVADMLARLFVTYVALPPSDPDPHDDAALQEFAATTLVPMISQALHAG